MPVLYLSRYITTTKPDYYRLLQTVRDEEPLGGLVSIPAERRGADLTQCHPVW